MRFFMAVVLVIFGVAPVAPVFAKAHLIAVIPLRSTADLAPTAAALTKQIAVQTALVPGYDAQVVTTNGQREVDAAAAAGAEIYIVGQLIGEDVTIDSFDVASDHRIGTMRFALVNAQVPAGADFAALIKTGAPVSNGAPAAAAAFSGSSYVLVPFGPPGNKDTALDFATTEFIKKLQAKGVVAVASEPLDQAQAGASIPQLCKEHSARGVLIGTARHEQRLNYLLGSYPTHAEVRVTLFPCDGNPSTWKGYGTGDIVYYWANAGAAISDVIGKALDIVVTQFPAVTGASSPAPIASP